MMHLSVREKSGGGCVPGVCRVLVCQKPPDDDVPTRERLCFVCGRLIAHDETRIVRLTGACIQICMDCRQAYAFRAVSRRELVPFVSDRLDRLSRAQLLRTARRVSSERAFIDWFYSGGYVETQTADFV